MKNIKPPIQIQKLAFLQGYLYEVFSYEKKCNNSFENSEWYLKEKYSDEEVDSILDFFCSNNINCDCDIIKKFDVREFTIDRENYHH